jgi:hypothetical protein
MGQVLALIASLGWNLHLRNGLRVSISNARLKKGSVLF